MTQILWLCTWQVTTKEGIGSWSIYIQTMTLWTAINRPSKELGTVQDENPAVTFTKTLTIHSSKPFTCWPPSSVDFTNQKGLLQSQQWTHIVHLFKTQKKIFVQGKNTRAYCLFATAKKYPRKTSVILLLGPEIPQSVSGFVDGEKW